METRRMNRKRVTRPPPCFLKPFAPRSNDYDSGMNSTGPRPPVFELHQISDYPLASFEDAEITQSFYNDLFASSVDGNVSSKNTPCLQFGSPTLSKIPPVLKTVARDLARSGGYRFPHLNLGEEDSAVYAPHQSGQVGITTGYLKSNDSSVAPVLEVAAMKIGDK